MSAYYSSHNVIKDVIDDVKKINMKKIFSIHRMIFDFNVKGLPSCILQYCRSLPRVRSLTMTYLMLFLCTTYEWYGIKCEFHSKFLSQGRFHTCLLDRWLLRKESICSTNNFTKQLLIRSYSTCLCLYDSRSVRNYVSL